MTRRPSRLDYDGLRPAQIDGNQEGSAMTAAGARATMAAEGLPRCRFTVAELEAMVAAGSWTRTSAPS